MVDEFKSLRDNLFKVLTGKDKDRDDEDGLGGLGSVLDAGTAKALLGAIFQRAGKGKDEVVGIVAREIGVAVAAMLKEPLAALAKNQKLQISFEFVPKDGHQEEPPRSKKPRRTAAAQKRPSHPSPKAGKSG
jgi:hypothetical protein